MKRGSLGIFLRQWVTKLDRRRVKHVKYNRCRLRVIFLNEYSCVHEKRKVNPANCALSLSSLAEESSEGNDEISRCHLGCVHLTQVWEVNSMRWAFHLWWSMVIAIFFFSLSFSLLVCIALPCLSLFESITKSIFQYVKDRFSSPFFSRRCIHSFYIDFIASTIENNRKKRRRTTTTMFVHLCLALNHSGKHSRLSLSPKVSKRRSFPISSSYLY